MSTFYQRYTDIFLTGLSDYARVTALCTPDEKEVCYITISQQDRKSVV